MLLTIDPEFQALIPRLTAEELAQLEASLQADGCREALVVWLSAPRAFCHACDAIQPVAWLVGRAEGMREGETADQWECDVCHDSYTDEPDNAVLADGHHRLSICTRLDITYTVDHWTLREKTRDEVRLWIIQNQLGRRNLSDVDRVILARQLRPLLEARGKQTQGQRTDLLPNLAKGAAPYDAREALADLAGVSHGTVASVETILDKGDASVIAATRAKDVSIAAALPLTDLPKPAQAAALDAARRDANGKKPTALHTRAVVTRTLVADTPVEPLPFMQRANWKSYEVLEAVAILGSIPVAEHAALNTLLDVPFLPGKDGLAMLRNLRAHTEAQRAHIYALGASEDPREQSLATTLAAQKVPEPDRHSILLTALVEALEGIRSRSKPLLTRPYATDPWYADLVALDTTLQGVQAQWRAIIRRIDAAQAERNTSHALQFQS